MRWSVVGEGVLSLCERVRRSLDTETSCAGMYRRSPLATFLPGELTLPQLAEKSAHNVFVRCGALPESGALWTVSTNGRTSVWPLIIRRTPRLPRRQPMGRHDYDQTPRLLFETSILRNRLTYSQEAWLGLEFAQRSEAAGPALHKARHSDRVRAHFYRATLIRALAGVYQGDVWTTLS